MIKRKTSMYYKASPLEKMYYTIGIPQRYWKESEYCQEFYPIVKEYVAGKTKKYKTITQREQRKWFRKFTAERPKELLLPYLVGIGGEPTDDLALQAGFEIIKKAISLDFKQKHQFKTCIFNLGSIDKRELSLEEIPDVLLLFNITSESTNERIQLARDLLLECESSFRIIVISGSEPISFFQNKLRLSLTTAMFFNNITSMHLI